MVVMCVIQHLLQQYALAIIFDNKKLKWTLSLGFWFRMGQGLGLRLGLRLLLG